MASAVPQVKITHHADSHGTRSPDSKEYTFHAINGLRMSTQRLINIIADAGRKFFQLFLRNLLSVGIRVPDLLHRLIVISNGQRICADLFLRNQHCKESCLVRQFHLILLSTPVYLDFFCCRDKYLHQYSMFRLMSAEKTMRIRSLRVHQFFNSRPIHHVI